jgi:hypothetical protein
MPFTICRFVLPFLPPLKFDRNLKPFFPSNALLGHYRLNDQTLPVENFRSAAPF